MPRIQSVSEDARSPALRNYYKNKVKWLAKQAEYRITNRETCNAYARKWRRSLKEEVHTAYGGKCSCCGEATKEFLTIDHIDGRGLHPFRGKKTRDFPTTTIFYTWLKKNNFPTDNYRLLCMNCNFSIGMWGYCPHTRAPE